MARVRRIRSCVRASRTRISARSSSTIWFIELCKEDFPADARNFVRVLIGERPPRAASGDPPPFRRAEETSSKAWSKRSSAPPFRSDNGADQRPRRGHLAAPEAQGPAARRPGQGADRGGASRRGRSDRWLGARSARKKWRRGAEGLTRQLHDHWIRDLILSRSAR